MPMSPIRKFTAKKDRQDADGEVALSRNSQRKLSRFVMTNCFAQADYSQPS